MSFNLIGIVFNDRRRNIMIKKIMCDYSKVKKRERKKRTIRQRKKQNYNWHFLVSYYIEKPEGNSIESNNRLYSTI